jgi:hypothetical protein
MEVSIFEVVVIESDDELEGELLFPLHAQKT